MRLAPFRDPARAHAGSALYRHFIVPLVTRVTSGRYRKMRLTTPTLILYGSEDPNMNTTILDGHQAIDGASHFIADEKPGAVIDRALESFA